LAALGRAFKRGLVLKYAYIKNTGVKIVSD